MTSDKRRICSSGLAALACLLAAAGGWSQEAAAADNVIKIDKPGLLDKPGATYLLTKDVTAPRTAFMIKGDGITLDLGGHTATYGTEVGVDRCSGVFLRPPGRQEGFDGVPPEGFGGGNSFTLKNGRIVQGPQPVAPAGAITYRSGRVVKEEGDHPRPGRYCHAVYIRGCDGFTVTGVTTEVNSRDTNNINILYCGRGEIAGNRCLSTVKEITNRHYPGTQVISVGPVGGPVDIHHNVIDGGGQWGINVSGSGLTGHLVKVHHNVIRHRSYTTNGYAIGCHAPNMRVYANVVRSVGRGIHLTANNIDFYNNIVEPREKPNPEYPKTRTHGIKLEGPTNTRVHHNFCRVVAEPGFGEADPLDFDCGRFSANMVYKNTIVALRRSPEFWAASMNVVRAHPENLTRVYDNVFRTNQYHFQVGWGGGSGITFENNRFEVIGDGKDYSFFSIWQGRAFRTSGMVFRDCDLAEGADIRKVRQLYGKSYTRANLDMPVQWTVKVRTVDPAGKPVALVQVKALREGKEVAQAVTDKGGTASVVLTGFHVIGNEGKPPFEELGPYELVVTQGGREVKRMPLELDPKETTDLTVTVTDPKRKLYVYAGEDQRLTTGDVAKLAGNVVVIGEGEAKPEVAWNVTKELGDPRIASLNSSKSDLVFEKPGESWLQQATLELVAKLGDEAAKDGVEVRQDKDITPKAKIKAPKTAKVGTIVQLDGSGSTEPRRFPKAQCTYAWKQVSGPKADLASTELPDPIFSPTEPGAYLFELIYSSPIARSDPAQWTVVVTK